MTPRLRAVWVALMLCPSWACHMQNESLRAEVVTAVLPDATCAYTTTSASYGAGFYDPTVDGGQGYSLTLLLRNNMQTPDLDKLPEGEITNINARAHDVQVTSFDACWFPADSVDTYGVKSAGGAMVDCSTIPEQSARIAAFGKVDEGGGLGLVQTQVLNLAALQSLFGAGYAPTQIPHVGRYLYDDPSTNPQVANGNQALSVRSAYAFTTEDPANLAGRSAAWGAKHPAQRNTVILVQMRANMQLQTGEQLTSNWFVMPITVCTGCMQDYCGPLVEEVCARGPCSDGTECLNTGACANTTLTCSPISLYSGGRPDFYGQTGISPCLPAQNFTSTTPLTCTLVGCQATN